MENVSKYYERIIDKEMEESLKYKPALYIKGLKYIGKTTTCKRFSNTIYSLGRENELNNLKMQLDASPELVFNKEKPILFDEWQNYPNLWNEVKYQVDEAFNKPGLFILTGSTIVPFSKKDDSNLVRHTGTGRFKEITMRTLSLYESKESNGLISLSDLFDENANFNGITSNLSLEDLVFATIRGGFPSSLFVDKELATNFPKDYFNDLVTYDISAFDNVKRNEVLGRRFLRSYAKNICTLAKNTKIASEIRGQDYSFTDTTFYDYKNVFESLFVIEDIPSWSPSFKSRANMMTSSKKNFSEPSLAIAALNLNYDFLINNLMDYGFFFESLVIRDLKIYSSSKGGNIYYYHDRNGLECDAVLVLNNGDYILIEIKLTERQASEASKHLIKIRDLIIDYNKNIKDKYMEMRLPKALVCIVGSKNAYTLSNGVHIVPISCLKD